MGNVETVGRVYEAFGRGDVPAILEQLADDVRWEYPSSTDVPWLQPRQGREAVIGFFEALGALDFQTFNVKELLGTGDVVVAVLDVEFVVKANGGRHAEKDQMHLWRFDDAGKVVHFRHGTDTLGHQRAFAGAVPA